MRDDYYELLGLQRTATAREVVRAFRRASLKVHPDKVAASAEAEQLLAAESYAALREAYDTLSDPTARERYDQRAKYISSHPDQVRPNRPATCGLGISSGLARMVGEAPPRAATAGATKAASQPLGKWGWPSPTIEATKPRAPSRGASRGGPGFSWGVQVSRNLSRPGSRASTGCAGSPFLDPLRMVRVHRVRDSSASARDPVQKLLPLVSVCHPDYARSCRLAKCNHA